MESGWVAVSKLSIGIMIKLTHDVVYSIGGQEKLSTIQLID